jgi:hypothetical protein
MQIYVTAVMMLPVVLTCLCRGAGLCHDGSAASTGPVIIETEFRAPVLPPYATALINHNGARSEELARTAGGQGRRACRSCAAPASARSSCCC